MISVFISDVGSTVIGGGRSHWTSLLKLLLAGGRAGSVHSNTQAVDFGTGFSSDEAAKQEKKEQVIPYERLPWSLRNAMTKKEYERTEYLAEENHRASSVTMGAGCLLPVVVFCFSKKKCEEIADYFKGQDLLTANEKYIVRAVKADAISRLNPSDSKLPQVYIMFGV